MTNGPMRRFSSSARTLFPTPTARSLTAPQLLGLRQYQRTLTDIRTRPVSPLRNWFTSSSPCLYPELDEHERQRLAERNLKLGNTIRVLHESLPTLLVSPLPQDVLSPHISLHLFPSTHPHLPTVGGKIAYTAALWTAPVAWGRVPFVGNVKLRILSERMVKNGAPCAPAQVCNEKLIVKWETCGRSERGHGPVSDVVEKITSIVAGSRSRRASDEFAGLFVFEFDEEGRIISHTIDHTEEGQHWDKTAKVISVTDWLLGRAWGRREEGNPSLAYAWCGRAKAYRSREKR
ncbi:hypothetical protein GQ44DRAFT_624603 [Phaeosphaeriaceae sp. PMI808]|nr:hypothetical protein GQ44DRAFT_624603 [Phaeosphaeriaceae sp. PMI808]